MNIPSITAATLDIDVAQRAVNIAEAALYPTLGVQGSISRGRQNDPTLSVRGTDQASVIANLNVPVYDGGKQRPRYDKRRKCRRRPESCSIVSVRRPETAVVAAWAVNEGSKIALNAATSEVKAAEPRAFRRAERGAGRPAHDARCAATPNRILSARGHA